MVTLAATRLTLTDQAQRTAPDGTIPMIAELLMQQNEVMQYIPMEEGNLTTGHQVVIRSGLPDVANRKINAGIPDSKSSTVKVTEAASLLEGMSKVDKELLRLGGNSARMRFTEDLAFMEAMKQQFATNLLYADPDTDPENHLGLSPRYDSLSADNAANIIDAGGSSDLTSVWLVNFDINKVFGIFPEGTQAGIEFNDLGEQLVSDRNGNDYVAMVSQYIWRFGLVVKDWRYAVRIANIDTGDLTKDASGSSVDLVDIMIDAMETIEDTDSGQPVFLVSRKVRNFLRRQKKNDTNVRIAMDEVEGRKVLNFDDVPVVRMDALLNTETQIT